MMCSKSRLSLRCRRRPCWIPLWKLRSEEILLHTWPCDCSKLWPFALLCFPDSVCLVISSKYSSINSANFYYFILFALSFSLMQYRTLVVLQKRLALCHGFSGCCAPRTVALLQDSRFVSEGSQRHTPKNRLKWPRCRSK